MAYSVNVFFFTSQLQLYPPRISYPIPLFLSGQSRYCSQSSVLIVFPVPLFIFSRQTILLSVLCPPRPSPAPLILFSRYRLSWTLNLPSPPGHVTSQVESCQAAHEMKCCFLSFLVLHPLPFS